MNISSDNHTEPLLVVLVNGELQLKYDRRKALPQQQLDYLQRMDQQMDGGISLGADWIERPDVLQRAKFVAIHLVESLQQGREATVAASCSYLAERLHDLKQVRAQALGVGFSVELVFDEPYVEEVAVNFVPRQPGK